MTTTTMAPTVEVERGDSLASAPDVAASLVKQQPQQHSYYAHRLGEELQEWLASQPFQVNQLVWVCLSKGRKKQDGKFFKRARIHHHQQQQQPNDDDNNSTTTNGLSEGQPLPMSTKNNDDDTRITVRYPKGSTYRVRPSNLWPILPRGPSSSTSVSGHVVVWSETEDYRRCCIQHTLVPDDYFVEVGCDYGITVAKVAATAVTDVTKEEPHNPKMKRNPYLLGIDKSTESIAIANERYPHLHFCQWDILDQEEPPEETMNDEGATATSNVKPVWDYLKEIRQDPSVDTDATRFSSSLVVAIDINGNRELEAVQACLAKVQGMWRPRLIIVKSRALHQQMVQFRKNS